MPRIRVWGMDLRVTPGMLVWLWLASFGLFVAVSMAVLTAVDPFVYEWARVPHQPVVQ